MHESPINVFYNEMITKVNESVDNGILEAVTKVGINVDRDELIKAISYDRGQYDKGFSDGLEEGKPKWISVKDRLPPNQGKKVLVVNGHGYVTVLALWKKEFGNKWTWIDEQGHFKHTNDITHWMPLPEPPKEE